MGWILHRHGWFSFSGNTSKAILPWQCLNDSRDNLVERIAVSETKDLAS